MFSIIIPTFNRQDYLQMALQSLVEQHFQKFEVIIVNDGGEPVNKIANKYSNSLNIELIDNNTQCGVSNARNKGIIASKGDFIALLDDDDIFLPHHLNIAFEYLLNSDVDVVYTGAVVSNTRLNPSHIDFSGLQKKAYPFDSDFLLVLNYIHTGSIVFRNTKNSNILFDENLIVCEDWDYWITLSQQLNYKFFSIPEITSVYHQIPGIKGLCSEAQKKIPSDFYCAREYIYHKWNNVNDKVSKYREWMNSFEIYRNQYISMNLPLNKNLFDNVIEFLHNKINVGDIPNDSDITRLLNQY